MVLSDLQAVDSVQLSLFKAEFETILMTKLHPIIKTLVFELLGQKGIDCVVTFETNQMTRQLQSTQQDLAKYYNRLDETSHMLLELDINEEMRALLHQHLIFFYQFHFPFIEEVNLYEVIEVFAQVLLGIELQFDKSLIPKNDSNLAEIEVIDLVNSYLRSLSSLM
ncbi:MAG: hypothetical protein K2G70_05535 [Turicibacter sp.]|nr:hypothetical protein [Turicibacter sp.]